ncbi:PEPxxWA-CTERM sorting domain-containing protein [Phenylobacterium sp.]|uniref:PEPxxWA-CTERM sorting domain-containing protein n=1 Tax=Phenylobacterium sp. TaxID=1871053 RepID=UPI0025F7372E|nr:PEPxxWA-CTERM sorting domain-containing protein [Phenylobacterium sp.]
MRKMIFAAVLAVTLGAASLAQAALVTTIVKLNVKWSGASFGNDARASGFITFDSNILPDASPGDIHLLPGSGVVDVGVDITGASSGNGHFGLADFRGFVFHSISPLDLTHELIGQLQTNGCAYGVSTGECGDGAGGDFNLFAGSPDAVASELGATAPNGTSFFELTTQGGFADHMLVTSMNVGSGAPEPAAWALMIGGFGLAGTALRRRRSLALIA